MGLADVFRPLSYKQYRSKEIGENWSLKTLKKKLKEEKRTEEKKDIVRINVLQPPSYGLVLHQLPCHTAYTKINHSLQKSCNDNLYI